MKGNPEAYKALFSQSEGVTIVDCYGLRARGWKYVMADIDLCCAGYASGHFEQAEHYSIQRIATYVTPDLAHTVEVERTHVKRVGEKDASAHEERATTIFRGEQGDWKIVHRQTDLLIGRQNRPRTLATSNVRPVTRDTTA